jgi:hypothetical protein
LPVFHNITGTTKPTFQIGKGGPTIHKGAAVPTGVNGDYWIDPTGEMKVKVGGAWELIHFDNLTLSGNTLSSTDTDGNISVVPDGVGNVVLGAAAGGTSTMTAPDDQDVIIQAGPGTGANDGGDLTLRGGSPEGAGADGDVILGTAGGGTSTMTAPDNADVVIQAGPATTGNPGADLYIRGGDGTGGTAVDGNILIDLGELILSNPFTFDTVRLTGIQTSGESFVDDDISLMTSAAINDLIAVAAPTPNLLAVTTVGSTTTTSITAASFQAGAGGQNVAISLENIVLSDGFGSSSTISQSGTTLSTTGLDLYFGSTDGDTIFRLPDSAGARKWSFKDLANVEVASLDSDGAWIATSFTGANVTSGANPGHTHTASSITGFVDLTTAQSVGGIKTFTSNMIANGKVTVGNTVLTTDDQFFLGTIAATAPVINFDLNDYMFYDRASNLFDFRIGATQEYTFSATQADFKSNSIFTTGAISGVNVTSGANPGHTHTGTSISALDAGDITTGTLVAIRGGTGLSTYATGDILYASATNVLSKLTAGTNTHILTLVAGIPAWAAPAATHDPVTMDGTGTYVSLVGQLITVDPITSGDITGTLTQNTTGSAAKWTNSRTVTFATGDVTGNFSIDGSANVSNVALTVANDSHTHNMANLTGTVYATGSGANLTSLTAANISSGNLGSGVLPYVTVDEPIGVTYIPYFSGSSSGNKTLKFEAAFFYTSSTNTLTATNFNGNASTASSAAKWTTARTVTFATGDVTGSFSIDGSAAVSNVDLTVGTLNQDTTGNATSASTVLVTSDETGDTNNPILFSNSAGNANRAVFEDSTLYFDNSNDILYSVKFSGNGASLTNLSAGNISTGTLAVLRGGTGVTTKTGTGSVVLSASPTFTGTVNTAALICTTFTSTGIDDNATKEVIAVGDTSTLFGDGSSGETYHLGLPTPVGNTYVSFGSGATFQLGSSIVCVADTYTGIASYIYFYADGALVCQYKPDLNSGTWDYGTKHITTGGDITGGAFTSKGINDDATLESLLLENNVITLKPNSAGGLFSIVNENTDESMSIGGGIANAGASIWMAGSTHGVFPNDMIFYEGANITLHYDDSASLWDFQANDITTTGDLTCGIANTSRVTWEGGNHAISINDGAGNINQRWAHSADSPWACTEAGYAFWQLWTQSSGTHTIRVSSATLAIDDVPTWLDQITIVPTSVTLGYAGVAKFATKTDGVTVTGDVAASTFNDFPIATTATADTIVARNGSGYIYGNYVNMSNSASNSPANSGMGAFVGNNGSDTFMRSYSPTAVRLNLGIQFEKHITIESPVSGDDVTWFFTNKAITCTELRLVNRESGAGSCVVTIRHSTDRNATGTIVDANTVTSNTTGHDITAFTDSTIPANSFVWVEIGTTTNTVSVHATLIGTYD